MRRATLSRPPLFALTDRAPGRLTLTADTGVVAHLFVLEEDIARLLLLADGTVTSPPSWAIAPGAADIAEPGRDRLDVTGFTCPAFLLEVDDAQLVVATAQLRVTIRLAGLHCRWEQRDGDGWRLMAEDRPTQSYDFGWWDGRAHHYSARRAGERFYGLGDRSGDCDRAGRSFRLTNLDAMGYDAEHSDPLYKSIPYLLVADAEGRCHGAFYDSVADVHVDLGRELDNYHGWYRHIVADAGDLDLWMIAGPDPRAVTRRFTWLTGRPALMPRWSLGYSGSTMSYTDAPDAAAQMAGFLDKLAEHDIGCTSFHLSSGYTSIGDKRYVFHWNRDKFPDPAAFVASFAEAGVQLVPNIKPALLRSHPRYDEVAAAGLFVADADGAPVEAQFWDEVGSYIDFTNPDAAAWWQAQFGSALLDQGMVASWNDNNEYEIWDARARFAGFGTPCAAAAMRPVQPILMTRASRHAQMAAAPERRPYVVTRAGMAGLQRYAQTWTGDNLTEWKSLRYNARMAIGLALSGVSNSGHDVGGFAGPAPSPELLVRWVQAGVLMPRFSIHSWNDDRTVNEPWMYPDALPAIRRLMALRQALVPFFYDLLHRYHADCEPMVRPTWLDFPDDAGAWAESDEHLLGPDLLAAPVVEPGALTRTLRAPAGAEWVDVWTGGRVAGGAETTLDAPLDGPPPLLARAGSAMLVDLATGGWRPAPYRRGVWLFPPRRGVFAWDAVEDAGDGAGAIDRWHVTGEADDAAITVTVWREGPGTWGDEMITLLLPPGEVRALIVNGGSGQPVEQDGRRGITLTVA
ncbi:glycoside hydrolase family 31 protein [Sphingomonas sp. AR_OL41]|uniref:glycoside hydrolase family 31 protein n=1 Tax=Sphingomonas sp. AR_OL41 TaxID=3042729 RepID=UPI00247FF021|nr:TIM-barrel domain-containing protein [Sphingomonas sp. AR_OL41]MDH7974049.1 glycoside hydrolase family 31 protein [Sphingomonas sp. AR_OL41]